MSNHKVYDSKIKRTFTKQFTQEEDDERTTSKDTIVVNKTLSDWEIENLRLEAIVHISIEELLIWARGRWNLTYPPKLAGVLAEKITHRANKP